MSDCATYGLDEASLLDCKKINFVYGSNGSGKTTIGNYLKNLDDGKFKSCSIKWDGQEREIVVYNRDFRNKHFLQTNVPGVFTLGEATIEDIDYLEKLKKDHEDNIASLEGLKNSKIKQIGELSKCDDKFRDDVWDAIYKQNCDNFKEAFAGYRNNRQKFVDKIKEDYKLFIENPSTLAIEDLKIKYNSLVANKPEKCLYEKVNMEANLDCINRIIGDSIWNEVVVGNNDVPISKLIAKFDNTDWVNKGRKFIIPGTKICPFCQKETIDEAFTKQLESFFDEEYNKKIDKIDSLTTAYKRETEFLLLTFNAILDDLNIVSIGRLDRDDYSNKLAKLKVIFSLNVQSMQNKIQEPARKFSMQQTDETLKAIEDILINLSKEIDKHNALVDNYEKEKKETIIEIWSALVKNQKVLIDSYFKKQNGLQGAVKVIENKIKTLMESDRQLVEEIAEKGRNITGVQSTVDEINRLLRAYGYTNFKIVNSSTDENCYCIQRENGEMATNTLSEGEETFISFLYFMQYCKGSTDPNKVSNKKVMVLDDPISSLDSTVLYIVSSIVKKLEKDIRSNQGDVEQLFVLTHNVFFHKEASFVDGRTNRLNDTNFWIIRKDNGVSKIKAYGMDNPISTTYELLWKDIREDNFNSITTLQNTMRRIIENYFGMLGGESKYPKIKEAFPTVEEQMIYDSLVSWINDGSHTIPDDLYIDSYSESPSKYKEVFKKVFYYTHNNAHYDMMMGIK